MDRKNNPTQTDHEGEALRLEQEAAREAEIVNANGEGNYWTLVPVFILVSATFLAALTYFYVVGQAELPSDAFIESMTPKQRFEIRGLFGDQWGAFTGIMSGLSLAFVALSLFAQRAELRMSRREITMQRLELKYTRAQSHRQILELHKQRQEEKKREIFQKEPIILATSVKLARNGSGAEVRVNLEHHGAAACNLSIRGRFAEGEEFDLQAPQILHDSTELSHDLTGSGMKVLDALIGKEPELFLKLCLKYRNIAGGEFICDQIFSISGFSLKSCLHQADDEFSEFNAKMTTFRQGEINQ